GREGARHETALHVHRSFRSGGGVAAAEVRPGARPEARGRGRDLGEPGEGAPRRGGAAGGAAEAARGVVPAAPGGFAAYSAEGGARRPRPRRRGARASRGSAARRGGSARSGSAARGSRGPPASAGTTRATRRRAR